MSRPPKRGGSDSRGGGGGPRKKGFFKRKSRKACEFCIDKKLKVDYKNVDLMRKYINERGKIKPRRATGACAKCQRKITTAVKRARNMALIPFTTD
jgi:small subunit ribosomal protein S18